jgi:hypothetical protein
MIIDRSTTIKTLLDARQEQVIEALVKLNKNFSKLKNPVLRKLLAKRVSIEDACRIAGCNVPDFLRSMEQIGFRLHDNTQNGDGKEDRRPSFPEGISVIDFDVRPILSENKDPLKEILAKIKALGANEGLKIINSFEPIPLITLLKRKGFEAYSEIGGPDLVFTYFYRQLAVEDIANLPQPFVKAVECFGEVAARFRGRLKIIDVTTLEAPGPMHTILAELETLAADNALFVHHKKVPVYLLPHLHDQGFEFLISEDEPGKVSLLIFKP